MKTKLILATVLFITGLCFSAEVRAQGGPTNKAVVSAANYLVKLYQRGNRHAQQLDVPQLQGYALQEVALIKEDAAFADASVFEYVAVYQQEGSRELKVVVYNEQNQEQLVLSAVQKVTFDTTTNNCRIVLERTTQDGVYVPESLFVQGTLEIAQQG